MRKIETDGIKDLIGFFNAVNECEGKVELVTKDGDRLNLRSKLSQYIAIDGLLTSGKPIGKLKIISYKQADYDRLVLFF